MPEKPVAALRESVTSIQRLLAGETVTLDGKQFTLDAIGITHPATELFGAAAGIDYFRFAMAEVEKGLTKAGRSAGSMAYSTVALTCVHRDGATARAAARPILASFLGEFGVNILTDAYGISEAMAAEMPDAWLEDLTLVGTPAEVVEKIRGWLATGIDSICIFLPDDELERETLELVAEEVIPAFGEH